VILSAVLVALLAVFMTQQSYKQSKSSSIPIRGSNKAVLFLTLASSGQINVQLATAQALMEKHPNIKIHFASFTQAAHTEAAQKVARMSSFALRKILSAQEIMFHEIPGPDRQEAMQKQMDCAGPLECFAHPPGARGCSVLARQLEKVLWSWIGEEHVAIYHRIIEITRQVDPAVVVVNYTFRPAVNATQQQNQLHAIVSPLALVDVFALL
jgi:hypothetical protein